MTDSTKNITVRRLGERGLADFGWLRSRHTFSFGEYYDTRFMGFRTLRVINEDRVRGGEGFPTHPHRDMEIFSYVLEGSLAHRDSMGNERVLHPGQVQLMSAGRGVTHSEYNASNDVETHFLQVWIQPDRKGLEPAYTEWHPGADHDSPAKALIISPDGRDASATIRQDACVYRVRCGVGETVTHELVEGRGMWLQVMRGTMQFGSVRLETGDGASTEAAGVYTITAEKDAEALLFDLG